MDKEPWQVIGGAPRWSVAKPDGYTLKDDRGRTRIFRTRTGALKACDSVNADRHKRLTTT